jgi:hypothetical protein
MLDLTGAVSPWIRAAALEAVRPPDHLWSAWSRGDRLQELILALDEAQKRGWWIVIDVWTPSGIRSHIAEARKNVYIKAPEIDQDFFSYLHDIYLQMWNSIVRR